MRRDGTEMRDRYSLMYQLTRLSREPDCLTHDDRIEGVAGWLKTLADFLGLNRDEAAEKASEKRLEEFYGKLLGEEDRIGGTLKTRSSYRGKLRGGNAVARRKKLHKRTRRNTR